MELSESSNKNKKEPIPERLTFINSSKSAIFGIEKKALMGKYEFNSFNTLFLIHN